MNERLVDRCLAERELLRARANVTLSEHVAALVRHINHVYEDPQPNIEFTTVNKQGSLNVLLHDEDLGAHVSAQRWRQRRLLIHSLGCARVLCRGSRRALTRHLRVYIQVVLLVRENLAASIVYVEV